MTDKPVVSFVDAAAAARRAEIARDVAAFLAAGGEVEQLPLGASAGELFYNNLSQREAGKSRLRGAAASKRARKQGAV